MTEASIVDELVELWCQHDDKAGWRHPTYARELADAACLVEVVFPSLVDRIQNARGRYMSSLDFSRAPRLVAQVDLARPWGYLNFAARARHGSGMRSRRPEAGSEFHSGTYEIDADRDGTVEPAYHSLAWILRRGHGTAVALWRAHRSPPAPTGFEPTDDSNRMRSEWMRRTAFNAILSRPRLSRHLRAEILRELGITVEAGHAAVQSDLLPDEPSTAKGAGIRIPPANYHAAIGWSRHPQCEPELAYLIQRALASTGHPRVIADLVLHPDAHPIVQAEARAALVRRMVQRPMGELVRFLALTSPWCPSKAVRDALTSPYPEERRAAELHPAVEAAWKELAEVLPPFDASLRQGRVRQTELPLSH